MRTRFALGLVAALALTACGGQTKPAADTSVASASSATSNQVATSSSVKPATGDKPTREFVIGKWGTNGDCTLAIDLRADGTSDGPFGNWSYSDGVIGFPTEPEFKLSVTVIDAQTMESTNGANTSKMTRCP